MKVKVKILRGDAIKMDYNSNEHCPLAVAIKRILKPGFRDKVCIGTEDGFLLGCLSEFSFKRFGLKEYEKLKYSKRSFVTRTINIPKKYLVKK